MRLRSFAILLLIALLVVAGIGVGATNQYRQAVRDLVPPSVTQFIRAWVPQYTSDYIQTIRQEYDRGFNVYEKIYMRDIKLLFKERLDNLHPDQMMLRLQASATDDGGPSFVTSHKRFTGGFFSPSNDHTYLDRVGNTLWLGTKAGIIFTASLDDIVAGRDTAVRQVPTNMHRYVSYPDFFVKNVFGFAVKDILIDGGFVYLSYVHAVKRDCYTVAILRAPLNEDRLEFSPFTVPGDCIFTRNAYREFSALQSGGKLAVLNDSQLIFSLGEFRFRTKAQEDSSPFGKLHVIDKTSGQMLYPISKGHRNVQGLFVDTAAQKVWLTEHGPKGGDEINVLPISSFFAGENEVLANFGWPISSYGDHYIDSPAKRVAAPLHKDHKSNGFIEPVRNFTPSIGISSIEEIRLPDDPQRLLAVAALGMNVEEGDMAIHFFKTNEGDLLEAGVFKTGTRVRDLLALPEKGVVIYSGEDPGSIGVLPLTPALLRQ